LYSGRAETSAAIDRIRNRVGKAQPDAPKAQRKNKIYIVDFGGQYAHLLAQRIRKVGQVFTDIVSTDTPASFFKKDAAAIVLSGGPQSVFDPESVSMDPEIFNLGIPMLCICYGHQLLCQTLGGKVIEGEKGEYGRAEFQLQDRNSPLLRGLDDCKSIWMSHRDEVSELPEGFSVIGSTSTCEYAAVANHTRQLYGLQFHPEVVHSVQGERLLSNFVDLVGGVRGTWTMDDFIELELQKIKDRCAGDKKVFLLCSGGVDSTVLYAMLAKALPADRVLGLFIDTGFMRHEEGDQVTKALNAVNLPNLRAVDASELFFERLEGITEPEKKRIAIGDAFLEVQRNKVEELGLDPSLWLLAQGTIYPDTIESGGTKNAAKIKTHHNRVPQIQALIDAGLVIESLAQLYKDEVREVGERLGLPKSLVWRHPFPGPGLAVRLLCSDKAVAPFDNHADAAVIAGLVAEHSWSSAVLPVRSVGVQGDARTYSNAASIQLTDGESRDWELLDLISTQITNSSSQVNRVLLQLAGSPSSTLAVHSAFPVASRVALLQQADKLVHDLLIASNWVDKVWQFPVVLAPMGPEGSGDESIILRPVDSTEAMTAQFSQLPQELLDSMTAGLMELDGICAVFFDTTNKPPGTIEWE